MVWAVGEIAPDIQVVSDAASSWGCGAHWLPHWFFLQWPLRLQSKSIQVLELIPVVITAAIFGKEWAGKTVQFVVDNKAVVDIIQSGYSKESHLMHLIRLLTFFACYFEFWFSAVNIEGVNNVLEDAISRNNFVLFFAQASPTPARPSTIPPPLIDLLSQVVPWTSTSWTQSFSDILRLL